MTQNSGLKICVVYETLAPYLTPGCWEEWVKLNLLLWSPTSAGERLWTLKSSWWTLALNTRERLWTFKSSWWTLALNTRERLWTSKFSSYSWGCWEDWVKITHPPQQAQALVTVENPSLITHVVPTRCCVVVCYWECVAGRGVGFSTVTSACACSGGWVILTQSSQHPQLCDENFEVHKRSRVLRANVHHEDLKVHKRSRVLRANGSQALTNVESHLHLSSNWYYIKCQDYSHQKRIKTLLFCNALRTTPSEPRHFGWP